MGAQHEGESLGILNRFSMVWGFFFIFILSSEEAKELLSMILELKNYC
jgi:hypothetical protein